MGSWKGLVLGFILALVLLTVGAWCCFGFGLAPVATAAPPMPFEKYLANRALHAAVASSAGRPSPIPATEPNLMGGGMVYSANCAMCHGLPGQEMPAIAKGMFPQPPQLFRGKGVTDDPVGETFWKVQNGIRLTGMPAFKGSLTEEEMWQVSLLLAQADKLPASARSTLTTKQ
jgi:mono/diheme cytochrome c family protein